MSKLSELLKQLEDMTDSLSKDDEAALFYFEFLEKAPFPAWIKLYGNGDSYRMLHTNAAYAKQFGIKATHYQNLRDDEAWANDTAQLFREQDDRALREGVCFYEEKFYNTITAQQETWYGAKWRLALPNKRMAVAGILLENRTFKHE